MTTPVAITVLALDSVTAGTRAADAMIKRAPITDLRLGTVQPGRYIIVMGGSVAAVEEAHLAGTRSGGMALQDHILLPDVHDDVYSAVFGTRRTNAGETLAILECASIPTTIRAADRAVKSADVIVVEIRLGDGLGGKGLVHLCGELYDVQAAVTAGTESGTGIDSAIIPAQHADLQNEINRGTMLFGE